MYVIHSTNETQELLSKVPVYGKEKAIDISGDYFAVYVECKGKVYARRLVKHCVNKESGKSFWLSCAAADGFLVQLIYHRLDVKYNF